MLFNSIQGQMFKTTVGVRQGCLLSPVLFNLFLEEIMARIQDEHISTISIGGRNLSNLRFADDIDFIAGSNDDLKYSQTSYQVVLVGMECKLVQKRAR